jgi:hypothetical protein
MSRGVMSMILPWPAAESRPLDQGHVGWRIAARGVGDAAVAAREVSDLRFPAAMVAGELMHEQQPLAGPGALHVQRDAIVGLDQRHLRLLGPFPLLPLSGSPPTVTVRDPTRADACSEAGVTVLREAGHP